MEADVGGREYPDPMATWTVRGTTIAAALSIHQLESLAVSVDGGTIYDRTSGKLAITFSVESSHLEDATKRALQRIQHLPALESIEVRRW